MASDDLSSVTDSCYPDGEFDELEAPAPALYGRSRESLVLLKAYLNVRQTNNAKRVLVHGVSGSGKTALVDVLREPVCESQGYFVVGKFFQDLGMQEPYSAIMAAFSDLCDLVSQSDDFTEERRSEIQQKLGSYGRFLAKSITNLTPFLDQSEGGEIDTRNDAALARFKTACKTFLHAMSSDKHPIVLFVDDIQWMDDGSRQLIRLLLNDPELKNVMLILAYRDEDENSVADIFKEENKADILDMPLQNLQAPAVHQLVCEMLGSSSVHIKELSDHIALKTRGNAFHVIQFVEVIQREGLLMYDTNNASWEFDVDKIQCQIMVSETLADLLALKVRRLPSEILETLQVASLLGFRFSLDTVLKVKSAVRDRATKEGEDESLQSTFEGSLASVKSSLSEALDGGFIEKTKEGYQFSHDKVQEAFQSLFDETEEEELHLVIGDTFLSRGDAESTYHAAVHLHHAPEFVQEKCQRIELARINLQAAKYCKEKSAFEEAATLLHRGLELLDADEKWTVQYDLAFEITETLAKMELVIGNHGSCKDLTREALFRAKSTETKINSLLINVECCMTCNEMDGSIAAANCALKVLGIKMPPRVASRDVMVKLLKVKCMIGRKSDEDILALPLMRDEAMATAVRILLYLCTYCFLKDEGLQAVYSALLATELTLKSGLSPYSASAFTIYGIAELSNGNYRRAYRFGKLALTLLDQIKHRDAECPTTSLVLSLLTHWYEPICDMPDVMRRAARGGFEVGDVMYGTYCLATSNAMEINMGVNLEQLEVLTRGTCQQIRDLSQGAMVLWSLPALQFVLNMRSQEAGDWKELSNLTGEAMEEDAYMRQAFEKGHSILKKLAGAFKIQLAFWFGYWSQCESIYKNMLGIGKTFHYSHGAMPCSLFVGISSYSLYQQNGNRKHLKSARKHRETLGRAESRGCTRASAFLTLLDAEELSVRKSMAPDTVAAAYNRAIQAMAAEGFPNLEGLANERAAFFKVKLGDREQARKYFERAMKLYKYEWGAIAKCNWLKEESAKALARKNETEPGVVVDRVVGLLVTELNVDESMVSFGDL